MANSTFLHTLLGASGSLGEGNSSTSEPYVREFHEKKVQETSTEIHGLQPFTVYRIDLHACNDEIQQCSAPAFAFPRTEPAGEMTVNSVRVCCWENWIKHTPPAQKLQYYYFSVSVKTEEYFFHDGVYYFG